MRRFIIVVLLGFISIPVFAQTRVGEIPYIGGWIPGCFTNSGSYITSFAYHRDSNGEYVFDTVFLTNSNFQIQSLDLTSLTGFMFVGYLDIDGPIMESDEGVVCTQSFFNNDDLWEFIIRNEDKSFSVIQENGNNVYTFSAEGEIPSGATLTSTSLGYLKWGGNMFVYFHMFWDDYSKEKYVFYRYNTSTQSIQRVSEMPFNVFPTLVDCSQEITIELDEGNNATELSVFDANGRLLETITVQAGQREVKIPASTMGHGLNLLNARDRQRQATRKIIVK